MAYNLFIVFLYVLMVQKGSKVFLPILIVSVIQIAVTPLLEMISDEYEYTYFLLMAFLWIVPINRIAKQDPNLALSVLMLPAFMTYISIESVIWQFFFEFETFLYEYYSLIVILIHILISANYIARQIYYDNNQSDNSDSVNKHHDYYNSSALYTHKKEA